MNSAWAIRAIADDRRAEMERDMRRIKSVTGAHPIREKARQARNLVGALLASDSQPSSRQRRQIGAPTSG
jgi:hypothetical protein